MQKLIFENDRSRTLILGDFAPYILEKIDVNTPKTTFLTSKAPGQDGKTHHGTLLEEVTIPIQGAIQGFDVEDMYRKRRELTTFFNPKSTGKCTYTNDYKSYEADYVVESLIYKDKVSELQDFLLQITLMDPYWTDSLETKEEIALWQGDFEFDLEITDEGIEMEHRVSSLIVNVLNKGDEECGMRIEFKALATVVNPSLFDVNTRKYIKVKRTLTAGDKLCIDTRFGKKRVEMIKSNGTTQNVFNYIELRSTFLQLAVGDNLLRYDAEQGIDNLEVSIYHKPKYIGW